MSKKSNSESNLKDVESWVREQIESKDIKEKIKKKFILIKGLEIQGDLNINGEKFPVSDLRIISSPGGGSCLIHSFLTVLSDSYCKLSPENKANIGEEYRMLLSRDNFFSEEEKLLLSDPRQNLEQEIQHLDKLRNDKEPYRTYSPTYEQWLLIFAPNHRSIRNPIGRNCSPGPPHNLLGIWQKARKRLSPLLYSTKPDITPPWHLILKVDWLQRRVNNTSQVVRNIMKITISKWAILIIPFIISPTVALVCQPAMINGFQNYLAFMV